MGSSRCGTKCFSDLINSSERVIYIHELVVRNHVMMVYITLTKLKYVNGFSFSEYENV